ncbi:MAG TPA: PAS domain S-box protein [Verrucomicrobiae bacterium]|nr:PAS domain S-box protein [Verrucomicrobiae bacterium]
MATEQNSGRPLYPSHPQGLPGEPPPWDEPPRPRSSWLYYAFAISLTAVTLLTDLALMAPSRDQPTAIVFLIPVALAAYFGGFGPGLVSTFLGLVAYVYFVAPSAGGFAVRHPVDFVRLVALLLVGVLISLLSESLHRSKERVAVTVRERRRSDEMLVESERQYRSLFENMSDGFAYCRMVFNEQGHPVDFVYVVVNAAFGAQTGLENVVGKKVTEAIPGIAEAHPELFEIYGRVSLTGRPERFDIEFRPLNSWFSVLAYSPRPEYFVTIFENITKRKESEQAIRDDEEELKAIYDNMPLVMLLMDGDRRVCKANKFAGQFAGSSPDDLIGQRSGEGLNCVHSLDDPRGCGFGPDCRNCAVRLAILDTVTTGRSYRQVEATLSVRAAEGTRDVAILLSTTKLDIQGRPRVLVTMQDITERKRAEEERRLQLRVMSCITEKSSDSIFLTDTEGRVTFLNPEAERVFGYKAEEMKGQVLDDLIHHHSPDGQPFPSSECRMLRVCETGETLRHKEDVFFRKDGARVEASHSNALLEMDGRRLGAAHVLHDLTDRNRMEEDLRQQSALLDLAPVLVRDMEGRIVLWTRGAADFYGYSHEEATGRLSHELLQTEFPQPLAEIEQILRTEGNWEGEVTHRTRDGNRVIVASRGVLYRDTHGTPVRVLVVNADITQLKRAEALRVRSQKLEALGTLAGGIAHDFNYILAAINGNADLALSELTPDHPARECLTEIAKGGARAADLVRSILGFARPVEQKRKVQALLPVIEEAVKFVRATLPASIEIRADFAPDLPAVNADSTQIHQIIVNLATNAAHAIGDRPGHIDVRLDAVSVSSEQAASISDLQEGPYVRLFVSDDGCGMDAATRKQMFDPFFTTKPPGQGTGLGLSVVHGIVSSYNGAIKAFSEPGEGTAFHLYFPAVEQVVEESQAPRQETQLAGSGRRILYVDDEEALVFLATRKLEHMGYKVSGFTDAENALREFRLRPDDFDLVVTDVSMPGMSGLELARELIAVRANIPIIVTSGYVRPEDEAKAEEIGIREFLLKPVTIDALTRTLGIVCRELVSTVQTGGGG